MGIAKEEVKARRRARAPKLSAGWCVNVCKNQGDAAARHHQEKAEVAPARGALSVLG
jgi:hypothetical protein